MFFYLANIAPGQSSMFKDAKKRLGTTTMPEDGSGSRFIYLLRTFPTGTSI
jgi:hypothetical protein